MNIATINLPKHPGLFRIIIICLPPNCTHVLQFLDVRRWRQGQFMYQRVLSRVNIKALGCSYKAITVIGQLKGSGIFPLSKD